MYTFFVYVGPYASIVISVYTLYTHMHVHIYIHTYNMYTDMYTHKCTYEGYMKTVLSLTQAPLLSASEDNVEDIGRQTEPQREAQGSACQPDFQDETILKDEIRHKWSRGLCLGVSRIRIIVYWGLYFWDPHSSARTTLACKKVGLMTVNKLTTGCSVRVYIRSTHFGNSQMGPDIGTFEKDIDMESGTVSCPVIVRVSCMDHKPF